MEGPILEAPTPWNFPYCVKGASFVASKAKRTDFTTTTPNNYGGDSIDPRLSAGEQTQLASSAGTGSYSSNDALHPKT